MALSVRIVVRPLVSAIPVAFDGRPMTLAIFVQLVSMPIGARLQINSGKVISNIVKRLSLISSYVCPHEISTLYAGSMHDTDHPNLES